MNSIEALDYAIKRVKFFYTRPNGEADREKKAVLEALEALRQSIADNVASMSDVEIE